MAIAAVIVLHGRVEKSNFIDIQGEKKKKKKEKRREQKKIFSEKDEIEAWRGKKHHSKGGKKRLKNERYRDRCDGGRGYGRDKREKETLAS